MKKKGSTRLDKRLLIGIVFVFLFIGGWALFVKNKTNHPQNPQYAREIFSTKFTNDQNGYTISYPTDWTIDTSRSQAPADLITDKTGDALVAIQTIDDQRLLKESGDTKVANDLKQGFVSNADYTLDEFKQTFFDGKLSYFAKGSFKDSKGEWNFIEYTILAGGERLYIVRTNTKKNASTALVKAAESIATSFSLVPYHKVALLAEVEEFESAVIKNGRSKFGIWVDSWPTLKNPYYTVQVFETFPDHRTTFNWYRVNQKDGKVYRQNIAKDTWEEVSK